MVRSGDHGTWSHSPTWSQPASCPVLRAPPFRCPSIYVSTNLQIPRGRSQETLRPWHRVLDLTSSRHGWGPPFYCNVRAPAFVTLPCMLRRGDLPPVDPGEKGASHPSCATGSRFVVPFARARAARPSAAATEMHPRTNLNKGYAFLSVSRCTSLR